MVVIERSTAPSGFFGPFKDVRCTMNGTWMSTGVGVIAWLTEHDSVVCYDPYKHQRLIEVTVLLNEQETRARALELTDDLNRPEFYSAKDKFGKACKEALEKHEGC